MLRCERCGKTISLWSSKTIKVEFEYMTITYHFCKVCYKELHDSSLTLFQKKMKDRIRIIKG